MNDWSKPASDLAARIGARATTLLDQHAPGDWSDRDQRLIARACALAVDEVLGYMPHETPAPVEIEGSER